MPQPLDNLARDLRAAVLAGDHQKGSRLTEEYTSAVRDYWIALSENERAVSPLPKQSLELLRWTRDMTLMQQAMAAQHLALVQHKLRNQRVRSLYLQTANADPRA